jgi:hypothetical protein
MVKISLVDIELAFENLGEQKNGGIRELFLNHDQNP